MQHWSIRHVYQQDPTAALHSKKCIANRSGDLAAEPIGIWNEVGGRDFQPGFRRDAEESIPLELHEGPSEAVGQTGLLAFAPLSTPSMRHRTELVVPHAFAISFK